MKLCQNNRKKNYWCFVFLKKKPSSAESSKLREKVAVLEEEKGNLQLRLVESEEAKTSLEIQEKRTKDLEERCSLLEEEKKSLTLKLVEVEEEKGHVQLQNVEYEDKFNKDEKQFENAQNEKLKQLMSELGDMKKALGEATQTIEEKSTAYEGLSKVVEESKTKEALFDKERTFFDQT